MLAWKNYGNSHVIFDASAGTTPSGTACSNTNPDAQWGGTSPTLMGWNGSSTYGVRVDTARIAENIGGTVAIANGGTGGISAINARNNLDVPSRAGGGASGTWSIAITGNAGNTSSISNAVSTTYTWPASQQFTGNGNTASAAGIGPQAYSTGGNGAIMAFHRGGAYAVNFGLDSDNVMRIGGWSASANRWQLDMSGNVTVAGSSRAPIFYDSNDTGYYVDPASVSNMNYLGVQRGAAGYDAGVTGSFSCNNWFRSSGGSGWYSASYGGGIWMQGGTFVEVYGGKAFYVANQVQGTIFYDANDTAWYCDPNDTSRFRILSVPSNVGSGTFPMSISSTDRGIIFGNSSGSGIPCYFTVNSGGTVSGSIIASGGSTSFNTSSDYRMKENDVGLDTSAALAKIMSLRPVTFDWKEQFGGRKGIGFIAHELDLVAPECVNGEKDAVNDDGTINPQSVDTSWLIPSMCSAMQKQQEMIEQLMAKVAVLEGI
jgi:hypothetical protein